MTTKDKEQLRKELGEKLRKAREKAGLTQAELAEKAGLNGSYYAEIERGEVNPSVDKLHDIAQVLKLKTFDIL